MDILVPQFSNSDVIHATGLDAATLQTWANRKIITPASEQTGPNLGAGARRLYSAENVLQIAFVGALVDAGVTPSEAVLVCDESIVREVRRTGRMPFEAIVRVFRERDYRGRHFDIFMPGYVHASSTEPALPEMMTSLAHSGKAAIVIPTRKIEEAVMARLQEIIDGRATENAE
jgi:DNA-binding transcriptional MerR regulator